MIRTFRSTDAAAWIACWNQAMPQDGISERIFLNRVLTDVNFDREGVLVAEEGGRIVGGLIAVVRSTPMMGTDLEPESGWITAFFVHPDYRRRGIGHALLEAADKYFLARGRQQIYFASYAPNYFVPGLDRAQYPIAAHLLESHGFRTLYQAVAMDKNLVGFAIPDEVRDLEARRRGEGYLVEPLTLPFVAAVLEFTQREFDPDWTRAIREAIKAGVPMSHTLIARRQDVVVGFALYGGYDGVAERFGPFGVASSLRGTGLGKILLYRCLEQMRQEGLHGAWFLWTGENEPAGHLYRRAGFSVTRRFDIMKKTLTARHP
ncbi:MAG: GNAT family N-acetyltransferase [Firmicutes bacterium]|nr:GNAT family N-acetyltransferase [Bacillota bacterium]